ncbi:purine nucleoside phosphorylase 1-like [Convolutriloba macropyga]|uniref:purine nucleoside phosphorylase 1-like n=1 Tax=Convolutriloba macropyga TaxID=536237 RepID=UPI003F52255E
MPPPNEGHNEPLSYEEVCAIKDDLQSKLNGKTPEIGIVLGSGLGGLGEHIEDAVFVDYKDVKHFPLSTVIGHKGRFICGTFAGREVLCMQGRFHCYEGHPIHLTVLPIRVMSLLGINSLILTNAAGGLNESFHVGDLMIIKDHINLAGMVGCMNPLIGPNEPRYGGERFIPTSQSYDKEYGQMFKSAANELGLSDAIKEGVYVFLSGPCFETIAEVRMLKTMGADAVGMSTIPEVLVAVHCGMRVLGVSLITNEAVSSYESTAVANHEEVLQTGRKRAEDMVKLVKEFLTQLK